LDDQAGEDAAIVRAGDVGGELRLGAAGGVKQTVGQIFGGTSFCGLRQGWADRRGALAGLVGRAANHRCGPKEGSTAVAGALVRQNRGGARTGAETRTGGIWRQIAFKEVANRTGGEF